MSLGWFPDLYFPVFSMDFPCKTSPCRDAGRPLYRGNVMLQGKPGGTHWNKQWGKQSQFQSFKAKWLEQIGKTGPFFFIFLICPYAILKRLKGNNANQSASTPDPEFLIAVTRQKCLWFSGNPHALLLSFISPWQEMNESPRFSFSKIRLDFSKIGRGLGQGRGNSLCMENPHQLAARKGEEPKDFFLARNAQLLWKDQLKTLQNRGVFFSSWEKKLLHSLNLTKDKTIRFHN